MNIDTIDAAIAYFEHMLQNDTVFDHARDCNQAALDALKEKQHSSNELSIEQFCELAAKDPAFGSHIWVKFLNSGETVAALADATVKGPVAVIGKNQALTLETYGTGWVAYACNPTDEASSALRSGLITENQARALIGIDQIEKLQNPYFFQRFEVDTADEIEQLRRENKALRQAIAQGADFAMNSLKGEMTFCGVPIGKAISMVQNYPRLLERVEAAESKCVESVVKDFTRDDAIRHAIMTINDGIGIDWAKGKDTTAVAVVLGKPAEMVIEALQEKAARENPRTVADLIRSMSIKQLGRELVYRSYQNDQLFTPEGTVCNSFGRAVQAEINRLNLPADGYKSYGQRQYEKDKEWRLHYLDYEVKEP